MRLIGWAVILMVNEYQTRPWYSWPFCPWFCRQILAIPRSRIPVDHRLNCGQVSENAVQLNFKFCIRWILIDSLNMFKSASCDLFYAVMSWLWQSSIPSCWRTYQRDQLSMSVRPSLFGPEREQTTTVRLEIKLEVSLIWRYSK